ncbi:ABC transporter ATP-binding protein [Bacillus tropicus]|uniref:ABC transporter ATP-binding protein n=1 Tax=Bacillus TaxID=1386 RepID=UPI000B451224|nr:MULTISPECIES: ABC transporter ATP-binding protein [Bacillus]MED3038410.1 ABC transporter ATP-binding protein [Bacillus tropicus]OTX85730.1 ABC transporter ATP-binding protein [Bacillus thuringiensis serovar chanpaisis]PNK26942.1 ABC transporter ATP-binding protein [Bacillus thuringiensis]WBO90922.1 ABC transporter ATP-binding protein [Bacillus tropicus]
MKTGEPISMHTEFEQVAPALQISKLYKRFGEFIAVNHINLIVPRGSFYGVVGPNGAGKTTSLSMAVGLLRPDGGNAKVFGIDVWSNPKQAKTLIGVLPDGLALPERLTGRELLTYMGLLRGMNAKEVAKRTEELLTILELNNTEGTLVINYSTGMRKKIGLALALLHAPKLLVLDEPFEAVDPICAVTIKKILQKFVSSGGTVVFSSHVMALVEQLCDHVAIISKGGVVSSGKMEDICGEEKLEDIFIRLVGKPAVKGGELSWLVF